MLGIFLSAFMLAFGLLLKFTKDAGLQRYKKFAWVFIALGIITLIFKIMNYQ